MIPSLNHTGDRSSAASQQAHDLAPPVHPGTLRPTNRHREARVGLADDTTHFAADPALRERGSPTETNLAT